MKLTNKHNLPIPLYNAVKNDGYHSIGDFSATTLLKSPRQVWLARRHYDELEEDCSDRIWALFGQSIHAILERGEDANSLVEEQMVVDIEGVKVAGSCDLFDGETVTDYKTTSVWSVIYGSSMEAWEQQLNIYAHLYRKHGFNPRAVQIVAILRDWSKSKAKFDLNYPQSNVVCISLPLWTEEKQLEFIESRVNALLVTANLTDKELPLCTKAERWQDEDKYAVMQKGKKRALKLHTDLNDAENHAAQVGGYVESRIAEPRKCADYCSCNMYCDWYNRFLEGKK